jgi:ABC-type lipoprotein release transport system permease subunit
MKWGLLIRLAFRNLSRNKRRNLISSVAIIAGVFAMVVGDGLVNGIDESVIRSQETVLGGHILMQPNDYPKDGRNYPIKKAIRPDSDLIEMLNSDSVSAWTSRLYFRTRVIRGADSIRVKTIGYDKENEPRVFEQEKWKIQGTWPMQTQEIAVGHNFASLLNLEIGNQVILEARTRPGALNALSFTVVGIVNAGNARVDSFTVWMPLDEVDSFIQTDGARSHISMVIKDGRSAANSVSKQLKYPTWVATTATDEVTDLLEVNKFRRKAFSFITLIIMAIAATGIMNTIIMAAYERITEVGTLRSMGMSKNEVVGLFLLEAVLLGLFAGMIGGMTGAGINYSLSTSGIDISNQINSIGEISIPTTMYTIFSPSQIGYSISFGMLVSIVASIWPALHSITINPADAVRRN